MKDNASSSLPMPYREKAAWLSVCAMSVAFVPYFILASKAGAQAPMHGLGVLPYLSWFAAAVTVQVLVLAAGHVYLRLTFRDDASAPPDERDRDFERRAITWAYYALISGAIIAGVVGPFTMRGWNLVNAVLFVIVAAEMVHYAGIGILYRKSA